MKGNEMASLTTRQQKVLEKLLSAGLTNEFTVTEAAQTLDITNKTASKYLSDLVKAGVVERVGRGVYKISENANVETEEEVEVVDVETDVENENTDNDENNNNNESENDNGSKEYDVYINGNYVSTIEDNIENIINQVRMSYPGALLEKLENNKLYFVEQSGTKG